MIYKKIYKSPFGEIIIISDGKNLTGLYFKNSIIASKEYLIDSQEKKIAIIDETIKWLDIYFKGKDPGFIPKYKLNNITPFRQEVIDEILKIPYGQTITYNDISKSIAQKREIKKMSAQAVGQAVGWNPIGIIIPCHRVIGASRNLTGYSGGMKNKIELLKLEGNNMSLFTIPKKENSHIINKNRCKWCNLNNELYIKYHDNEWGQPIFDDHHLFELLILESFQAGLSWECILNKRDHFRKSFDDFDINKICNYTDKKIQELLSNKNIIRNRLKINAAINNSKIFKEIQQEYKSFSKYIWHFTNNTIIYETDKTSSKLSDTISKDLQKRGMKFVGTTIIYSYLQAIGIIYSHEKSCFLYKDS